MANDAAATFAIGAVLPLSVVLIAPREILVLAVSLVSLGALALLGAVGARAGGAGAKAAVIRVTFWGAFAMAATAGMGRLLALH